MQLTPSDREVTDPKEGALAVLGTVKDNAADDALKAEALAAEGDINWAIATYAAGPGAGPAIDPSPSGSSTTVKATSVSLHGHAAPKC